MCAFVRAHAPIAEYKVYQEIVSADAGLWTAQITRL